MNDQVDTAGNGEVAGTGGDALRGEMDGGERGGASRIDGQARPMEVEMIGDEVGDGVKIGVAGIRAVHHTYEDPDLMVRSQAAQVCSRHPRWWRRRFRGRVEPADP